MAGSFGSVPCAMVFLGVTGGALFEADVDEALPWTAPEDLSGVFGAVLLTSGGFENVLEGVADALVCVEGKR